MTNVVKKTKPEDGTGMDDDFHQDGQGRPF